MTRVFLPRISRGAQLWAVELDQFKCEFMSDRNYLREQELQTSNALEGLKVQQLRQEGTWTGKMTDAVKCGMWNWADLEGRSWMMLDILTLHTWTHRESTAAKVWSAAQLQQQEVCVGIWLDLVAASQQPLLSICSGVRRGERAGYCCGTGPVSKNTSLSSSTGELGSGISRDVRLAEKAADAFSMPGRRQESCLGKWWVMAKAAKRMGGVKVKQSPGRNFRAKDSNYSLGNQQGGSTWLLSPVLKRCFFCWCFYSCSSSQTVEEQNWSVKASNQGLLPAKGTGRVLPVCSHFFCFT